MQNSNFKKIHFRHMVFYLYNKEEFEKKPLKIHADIKKSYPQDFCCLSFVKKWVSRFDKGDYDLEDKPRSGRPENFSTQKLEQLLDKNAKATTRELAKKLNFSQSAVHKKLIKIFLTQNTPNSLRRPLKDSWRGGKVRLKTMESR